MFGNDDRDVAADLLKDLGIEDNSSNKNWKVLTDSNSRYVKDLRVNIKNVIKSENLSAKEAYLLGLACAANEKSEHLVAFFENKALESEATKDELGEAIACASLLASNNITYRFRHFMGKESYDKMPMKIKMNVMLKPVLGKPFFELMSLAVSAINGCEMCVKSHEASLIELGVEDKKIWDAVRIAGVVVSATKFF